MGLKHLEKVEKLLKDNPSTFSKTAIGDILNINYRTINEIIAYLLERELIIEVNQENATKYAWNRNK